MQPPLLWPAASLQVSSSLLPLQLPVHLRHSQLLPSRLSFPVLQCSAALTSQLRSRPCSCSPSWPPQPAAEAAVSPPHSPCLSPSPCSSFSCSLLLQPDPAAAAVPEGLLQRILIWHARPPPPPVPAWPPLSSLDSFRIFGGGSAAAAAPSSVPSPADIRHTHQVQLLTWGKPSRMGALPLLSHCKPVPLLPLHLWTLEEAFCRACPSSRGAAVPPRARPGRPELFRLLRLLRAPPARRLHCSGFALVAAGAVVVRVLLLPVGHLLQLAHEEACTERSRLIYDLGFSATSCTDSTLKCARRHQAL